jgi:hypothetical protein
MRIHDRPEFGRRFQARKQRRGGARRHRHHHRIIRRDRDGVVAKLQVADMGSRHGELAQFMPELDAGALVPQQPDRGFDQNRAQSVARDQRAAGVSPRQQRFPHHGAGEPRRPLGRIDVERRQQQRLHQPLVERALARDGVADPFALSCPNQRHQCEIIGQPGVGYAASLIEHPQRQPAVAKVDLPALPCRQIDEWKLRALRTDQSRLGADRSGVGDRVMVARQQEMVAVVDGEVGRRIEIGPATAAGLLRGLVDMHLEIRIGQPNGGREARNSSADDVNGVWHQINA